MTHHLKSVDFPAHKQDLLRQAQQNGAGEVVLETIQSMPDGDFETMADVMKAYGEADRESGPQSRR